MGGIIGKHGAARAFVRTFSDACLCLSDDGKILAANEAMTIFLHMEGDPDQLRDKHQLLWDIVGTLYTVKDSQRVFVDESVSVRSLVSSLCVGTCNRLDASGKSFDVEISFLEVSGNSLKGLIIAIFREASNGLTEILRVKSSTSSQIATSGGDQLYPLVDTSRDAIVVIDQDGIIRSFNRAGCAIFRYSRKQVLNRNVKILMPPELARHHDRNLAAYFTTGVKKVIGRGREAVAMRSNKEVFPMTINVSEPVTIDGKMYFVGLVRDMTKEKMAEQRVTANAEWIERIIGGNLCDVMVDAHGKIHYTNDQAISAEDLTKDNRRKSLNGSFANSKSNSKVNSSDDLGKYDRRRKSSNGSFARSNSTSKVSSAEELGKKNRRESKSTRDDPVVEDFGKGNANGDENVPTNSNSNSKVRSSEEMEATARVNSKTDSNSEEMEIAKKEKNDDNFNFKEALSDTAITEAPLQEKLEKWVRKAIYEDITSTTRGGGEGEEEVIEIGKSSIQDEEDLVTTQPRVAVVTKTDLLEPTYVAFKGDENDETISVIAMEDEPGEGEMILGS
mmetsp:Transcript_27162/g.44284  ORF Transcript_27162/g.44284 Transcript_27162/m.44284 type:complete len:560 (-) Transcript_27162:206-1885(-)|eukprot:CAMPEP_0184671140 /NCGR_PEP_ID=MMETSP0308-20130426/85326_1 /TAXON_ID=38269 /ORGANISM="Gloeochaete witrockiana, Strain SAG 46.84" /LENGTH=559 /DNA_ID=CAMNT_0027118215 /DNA_START=122 /DNA_END=1801 /DNA_ORIENTATION=+